MTLANALLVLAGGFLGGIARFFVSGLVGSRIGEVFPWGTLAVNVSGALAIGLLAGLGQSGTGFFAMPAVRAFLIVGFCGGYTTVSSFALQTLALELDGERRQAGFNVAMSVVLCLAAVAVGFRLAPVIAW